MSGLAGVRWLDGHRRATPAQLRSPLHTLAHRGPDGLFARATGPCAMGIAHFVATPEARGEIQPFATPSLLVTFDGRLDNGDDLRAALGLDRAIAASDIAVVARAWERWGTATLHRLLGDFALAVWSSETRELWLARDVFALRPLLYRYFGGGFWWASEVQTLARLGDARVNEGVVAEYLIDAVRSETETLAAGVFRVPRASVLRLDAGGTHHVHRYWTPRVERSPRRSGAEYVDEFQSIFRDAVRARVRADRPVAICLSGGVDSSLITAEAAQLARAGRAPAAETFTLCCPGHPIDESSFALAVANHLDVSSTLCPVGDVALAPIVADAARALDLPLPPACVRGQAMNDALRDRALRVCLTGIGGDEWFVGNHFIVADLLRRLSVPAAVSTIRELRRTGPRYGVNELGLALWVQLPEPWKEVLRRVRGGPSLPGWIREDLAARVDLRDRLRVTTEMPDLPSIEQRVAFAWCTNADKVFSLEYAERLNAAIGCEERLPFMDRRLVEWALALPPSERYANGTTKVVLRNAARRVLPAGIADRTFAPDCSFETSDGLRQIGGREFVMTIAAQRPDWVSASGIHQLWDAMDAAQAAESRQLGYYSWVLWLLVATHLAARAIENCVDRWMDHGDVGAFAVATVDDDALLALPAPPAR